MTKCNLSLLFFLTENWDEWEGNYDKTESGEDQQGSQGNERGLFYFCIDLNLIYTSKFSLTSPLDKENLPTVHTSKFSLTTFPWQCKWKNMTSFSLTSVLVQKLFFHLHCQGKVVDVSRFT